MNFGNHSAKASETGAAFENLAALLPLFREIGKLKRICAANLSESFAAGLFRRAWSEIASGAEARGRRKHCG